MMRILHLIKGLARGGAEQLLVSAARYRDRSRFACEAAYLLPGADALRGELEAADLPVHCLHGGRGAGWIRRLRDLVRAREIDLVHTHSPYAAVGARVGLPRTVRQIHTEHNVWERYHRATYWANALTLARIDHVFAVSDQVRRSMRYPTPLRFRRMPSVETLYHGLDPRAVEVWGGSDGVRDELGIPEDAPVVGTVANLKAHKGHEHLLAAAVQVRRAHPTARFVLVGEGPMEERIRRQARDLGLEEAVVMTGSRHDAVRLAASFDLFALPSLYEGLSIALIEAMALGKPLVVTRAGGTPEVIRDGREGVVVPPGDPDALAEGIMALLGDRDRGERLGAAARRRAAEFDIRKAVRRMEQVYEATLVGGGGSTG